jgi:hypothetical protein
MFIFFSAFEKIVLLFSPLNAFFNGQNLAEQTHAQGTESAIVTIVVKIYG